MVLLDLLGRRWALRILWELHQGPATFRDLRARCDEVSPTVLNQRLRELRAALLIAHGDDGYAFTPLGESLVDELRRLDAWSHAWAKALPCDDPGPAPMEDCQR